MWQSEEHSVVNVGVAAPPTLFISSLSHFNFKYQTLGYILFSFDTDRSSHLPIHNKKVDHFPTGFIAGQIVVKERSSIIFFKCWAINDETRQAVYIYISPYTFGDFTLLPLLAKSIWHLNIDDEGDLFIYSFLFQL